MENNPNQTNETAQPLLIHKLMQRISSPCHNRASKIVKNLTAIAVASCIVMAPLSGCDPSINSPWNPTEQTDPESKHSSLLQSILDDSYYHSLIEKAKKDPIFSLEACFDPHPYSFLAENGHDIEKIKNGKLYCRTLSYTYNDDPTHLYIATYVENPGDYYTEYLLRYELTPQEMKDYEMLHGYNGSQSYYIQSAFINDAISRLKQVEILAENNVHVDAHKEIREVLEKDLKRSSTTYINSNIDILFLNINTETNRFDILCIPIGNNDLKMMFKDNIGTAKMKGYITMENSVYIGPRSYGDMGFGGADKFSASPIKLYNCQDAHLVSSYSQDLYEQDL